MSAAALGFPTRRPWPLSGSSARRVVAVAVLILVWQLVTQAVGTDSLPGPTASTAALLQLMTTADMWSAVGATLRTTIIGLLAAMVIAIPVGLLVAAHRFAAVSSRLTIDFLGSIPPISFLPLALLLYGSTSSMKLVIVVYGACWPLLVRTIDALNDVHPVQRDVADAFVLTTTVRWLRVYLPGALPGILVGVRISLTIALLSSVGAEYIGGAPGIGQELLSAQVDARGADVQAYAVMAAIVGMTLNLLMRLVERFAIGWHPSVRSAGASSW